MAFGAGEAEGRGFDWSGAGCSGGSGAGGAKVDGAIFIEVGGADCTTKVGEAVDGCSEVGDAGCSKLVSTGSIGSRRADAGSEEGGAGSSRAERSSAGWAEDGDDGSGKGSITGCMEGSSLALTTEGGGEGCEDDVGADGGENRAISSSTGRGIVNGVDVEGSMHT